MAATTTKTNREGNAFLFSRRTLQSSASSSSVAATTTASGNRHSSGSSHGTRPNRRNPVSSASFLFGGIIILQVCWFLISLHTTTTTTLRLPESGGGTRSHRKPPPFQTNSPTTMIPIFYNLYISNVTDRVRIQTLMADQLALRDPTVYGPLYVTTVGGYNPAATAPEVTAQETNSSSSFLEAFVFGTTRTQNHTHRRSQQQQPTKPPPQQLSPPRGRSRNSDYHHLGHYETGNELLSLQALWDYCQKDPESDPEQPNEYDDPRLVVYLHSKGAYTDTLPNTKLRYFLTATALSDDCRQGLVQGGGGATGIPITTPSRTTSNANRPLPPLRCNVCSGRFSPLPHPHTSGNMWMASCRYVRTLYEPSKFKAIMRRIQPGGRGHTTPACVGRQRWAAEHWIHSHPTVEPCDVYTNPQFLFNYEHVPNLTSVQEVHTRLFPTTTQSTRTSTGNSTTHKLIDLAAGPRFNITRFSSTGLCNNSGVGTLQDRLHEYKVIYKYDRQDIPQTWWGWKFYNTTK